MKINIFYQFKDCPWGGGNQFLKALKNQLKENGVYEDDYNKAEVLIFNSHHFLLEGLKIKKKYPEKKILLRLDGPVSLIRGRDKEIDQMIKLFSDLVVDGIIYQSNWSRQNNKENFQFKSNLETVIINAPDEKIFNIEGKLSPQGKKKIIATSWSDNWKKGFKTYQYLDENLDFNKYEMTFVGNSPVKFKNIKHVLSVPTEELAQILKQHHIFITASEKDPCSNSLIEALACGLPAVAYNDGGHPEIIKSGGETFNTPAEAIEKIDLIDYNYSNYKEKIPRYSLSLAADQYYHFAAKVDNEIKNNNQYNYLFKIKFYKILILKIINIINNKFWNLKQIWKK